MINFAYIYAMPGLANPDLHKVVTEKATFIAVAINYDTPDDANKSSAESETK